MKKWLVAAILLYALPLIAQTYEWTDETGTVNFAEDLGKVPKKYRKKARPVGEESGAPLATETDAAQGKGGEAKDAADPRGEKKQLYGGKEEKAWRGEFGRLNADLEAARKDEADLKARLSDTARMSRTEYLTVQNTLKHAQYRVQELKGKLQALNERADRADVPAELRQ